MPSGCGDPRRALHLLYSVGFAQQLWFYPVGPGAAFFAESALSRVWEERFILRIALFTEDGLGEYFT